MWVHFAGHDEKLAEESSRSSLEVRGPKAMAVLAKVSGAHGTAVVAAGNRKATERLVTDLRRKRGDPRAVGGGLRRMTHHPKAVQIRVLQRLVDERDWELALPMYDLLRQNAWYRWTPSLHASLLALLAGAGRSEEVLLKGPGSLTSREDMRLKICLIQEYAKVGLLNMALSTFEELQSLSVPGTAHVSHRVLLRVYIGLQLLHEAGATLRKMKSEEIRPSLDDYKALLHSYGKAGRILDMETLVHEIEEVGLLLDRSGFNSMLSAYAQAGQFASVVDTLERMRASGISFNVNSRNAISKHCPGLVSAFDALEEWPKSVPALCGFLAAGGLGQGEMEAVEALLELGVHSEAVTWNLEVWELDLHGMFLGTANLALFLWLQQVRTRCAEGVGLPPLLRVVTGWGKHSEVEGASVLRKKVHDLLTRTKSPFRPDGQNKGTMVSRGLSLKLWLAK